MAMPIVVSCGLPAGRGMADPAKTPAGDPLPVHSRSVLSEDIEALAQASADDHYRDRDTHASEFAELRVTRYLRHSGSRLWMDMCERVGERAKAILRDDRGYRQPEWEEDE